MLTRFYTWLRRLFSRPPVHLAIVRRYVDANGSYVGELYMYDTFAGVGCYRLVGCSLDSLPLTMGMVSLADEPGTLDVLHDFLAPLPPDTLRVGAAVPEDNDAVRRMIGDIPRRNIKIVIQNRFIERVMERKV
jgi:hypothetical protein